jgi:hypothetical protein
MELNVDKRRKRFKVWISDEERKLLDAKAVYYGYGDLSSYIRDSAIYEKVTYVNLEHRNEIYKAYANYTKEIDKVLKEVRHIAKYATQLSSDEQKELLFEISTISKTQKEMLKLIEQKLSLVVWYEINHNKGVEEYALHEKISTS